MICIAGDDGTSCNNCIPRAGNRMQKRRYVILLRLCFWFWAHGYLTPSTTNVLLSRIKNFDRKKWALVKVIRAFWHIPYTKQFIDQVANHTFRINIGNVFGVCVFGGEPPCGHRIKQCMNNDGWMVSGQKCDIFCGCTKLIDIYNGVFFHSSGSSHFVNDCEYMMMRYLFYCLFIIRIHLQIV